MVTTASTRWAENTFASNVEPTARFGLALVRLTIGAMFIWVFFENLGKDLYKPANYAGLINDYIQNGSAPAVWKHVMQLMASHASMAAPLQGAKEITELALLLVPIVDGRADITTGSRLAGPRTSSAMLWHARFAIGSLRTTSNSLLILSIEYILVRKKLSIVSQEAGALASNL